MAGFFQWLFKPRAQAADEPSAAEVAAPVEMPPPQPVEFANATAPTAAEICNQIELTEQVKALTGGDLTPGEFLQVLEQEKQYDPAVDYMANALPPRESVWWATQSARTVEGKMTGPDIAAMEAAESWVRNPTSESAAAAAEAAAATDYQGPGAWAAQAASWAEESSSAASQTIPPETIEIARSASKVAGLSDAAQQAIALGSVPADLDAASAAKVADEMLAGAQAADPSAGTPGSGEADIAGVLAVATMFASAATGSLAPVAVAGAVKVAAAIAADAMPVVEAAQPAAAGEETVMATPMSDIAAGADVPPATPPPDPDEVAKLLRPFIDLGKQIATGQNTWA